MMLKEDHTLAEGRGVLAAGHGTLARMDFDTDRAQRLVRAWLHLEAVRPLLVNLAEARIPWVGFRGPFAAMDLYDDLAARPFADIDLLVPRSERWRALACAESVGFVLRTQEVTRGFLARNHLHWPLVHRDTGVLVDLHWAVDHPYRLLRIDYAAIFVRSEERTWEGFTWRQPCPEHLYLLARVHASKHQRPEDAEPDLQMIRAKYGRAIDWSFIETAAKDWHITEDKRGHRPPPVFPGWLGLLGKTAGFRPERSVDARAYLLPDAAYFAPARGPALAAVRAGHFVKAAVRLSLAVADGLGCAARITLRRRFLAVLLCALAGTVEATCPLTDDHADAAYGATAIAAGTSVVTGVVGRYMDEDWFRFTALPGTTYALTLSTNTVWDATVALRGPDGETVLVLTNTARVSPAQASFTNSGTIGSFYLQVSGYLQFTTGRYGIVVSASNFTDTDGDGLSDAWETTNFGSLTNAAGGDVDGDGLDNLAEFYAGSSPGSSSSGLLIDEIARTGASSRVTWQAGKYGTYRVLTSTSLESPQVWEPLGTNVNMDGSALESFIDAASGATTRHYRVELLY